LLGEIFKIQTQIKDDWPKPSNKKLMHPLSKNVDPDPSLPSIKIALDISHQKSKLQKAFKGLVKIEHIPAFFDPGLLFNAVSVHLANQTKGRRSWPSLIGN